MAVKCMCAYCGRTVTLRADGKTRYHGPHPSHCPGGGHWPAKIYSPSDAIHGRPEGA